MLPCPTRCSRVDSLSPVFAAQIMSQLREMDTVEEQWTELYSSKRVTKASKFSGGSALCQVRHRSSAMNKLRIVTLRFGTARCLRHGVPSRRAKSAGVAKRSRELSPTRNPLTLRFATFASL